MHHLIDKGHITAKMSKEEGLIDTLEAKAYLSFKCGNSEQLQKVRDEC